MTKKRWDISLDDQVESPSTVEAFLDEYTALCRKHGMSLSHEDDQGTFIIEPLKAGNIEWVRCAVLRGVK